MISLLHPLASYYVAKRNTALPWFFDELLRVNLNSMVEIQFLEYLRLLGEGIPGLALLAAAILGFLRKEKLGVQVAYFSGLVLLVIINLLVFYFDQFSAILFTALQLAVFLVTARYRRILFSN